VRGAPDLDLAAHHRGRHLRLELAVAIDDGHVSHLGAESLDLRQHAHLAQDLHLLAAEVDGRAAVTQGRGLLDHGDLEAVAVQPVGGGRAGDGRSGNQDLRHFCLLNSVCGHTVASGADRLLIVR
jgi:hypothetical protein